MKSPNSLIANKSILKDALSFFVFYFVLCCKFICSYKVVRNEYGQLLVPFYSC
ncbi:hypothetical protein LguiA_004497 [Lonicera macranthoides]